MVNADVVERVERLRIGRLIGLPQQEIRESIRLEARGSALDDLDGEAAEVLDQGQTERDRYGPQLADAQRFGALKGQDEALQGRGIEPTVRVRDERPRQLERARRAGERPLVERGQLAIEAGREIGANLGEHFLDDVEVVHEPLGRGCRRALFIDDGGQGSIAAQQDASVFAGTRQQLAVRAPVGRDTMPRDRLRELLEPLDAEELGANGFCPEKSHLTGPPAVILTDVE